MSEYYLLNNKNPRAKGGFHGYASRNKTPTAIVLHTAENNPSSNSAVAIGQYFSRTERQASYHTVVDSSQALRLLPWGYTAFHVRGANSWTLGLSFATRAALWGQHPRWDAQAIEHAAKEAAAMAKRYGIPVRLVSAADARRGVKGFTTHAAMDPGRRSDPGAGFPMQKFLDRTRFYLSGEEKDDEMPYITEDNQKLLNDVAELMKRHNDPLGHQRFLVDVAADLTRRGNARHTSLTNILLALRPWFQPEAQVTDDEGVTRSPFSWLRDFVVLLGRTNARPSSLAHVLEDFRERRASENDNE